MPKNTRMTVATTTATRPIITPKRGPSPSTSVNPGTRGRATARHDGARRRAPSGQGALESEPGSAFGPDLQLSNRDTVGDLMADARSEGSASLSQHAHLPDRVVARGGAVHVHRTSVLLAAAVAQGGGEEPVLLKAHARPPVSVPHLEAVHERRDDLHSAAGGPVHRSGLECAVEGPEVADLHVQAARAPPGREQDAAVRPGLTVL